MALTECLEINKNSQLLVTVEEVLPDIIVVSFQYKTSLFQGVLLDSKKKLLPCGIIAPANAPPPFGNAATLQDDRMLTTSQRYSYFQEKTPVLDSIEPNKRSIRPPARFKNARMTVRLRPRQVLCSKCRGICNENSENVDVARKKKKCDNIEPKIIAPAKVAKPVRRLRSSGEISPRLEFPDNLQADLRKSNEDSGPAKKKIKFSALDSKTSTFSNVNKKTPNGRVQKIKIVGMDQVSCLLDIKQKNCPPEKDPLSLAVEDESSRDLDADNITRYPLDDIEDLDPLDVSNSNPPRIVRKKRSVGSMEDLWDENVFEDASTNSNLPLKAKTRIIKISYGSSTGEGTVLEIASNPQETPLSENEGEDRLREKTTRDASAKAARKALKKAKKEARRKVLEVSSPLAIGASSPRYSTLSPRYATSCLSPRQNIGNVSPQFNIPKKHKHKAKHKKKHKVNKDHKGWNETNGSQKEVSKSIDVQDCLKQKLSINLKRLSAHAYMRCDLSSPSTSDCSDEPSDTVPNFPGSQSEAAILTTPLTVSSCQTTDGKQIAVGDIIWGKIHGFPWWPGKVLNIDQTNMDAIGVQQAHISWYGSSTSSLVSTSSLNPFLDAFQIRYNKKKRGAYKEAIKQATAEAQRQKQHGADINGDALGSLSQVSVAS